MSYEIVSFYLKINISKYNDVMQSYLNIPYLLLRALYFASTGFIFLIFLTSATQDTGGSDFDVFAIPLLSAIVILTYAIRIREDRYILLVVAVLFIVGMISKGGGFLQINFLGISMFTLFFHALRPWK